MSVKKKIVKKATKKANPRKDHSKTKALIDRLDKGVKSTYERPKFDMGNQLYKRRSKHGRDILFSTHIILWEAACEYFTMVDENPLYEIKPIVVSMGRHGSRIEMQQIPKKRPYTLNGLFNYLDVNRNYFLDFKNSKSYTRDFSIVIERIERTIYDQKFDGAASGFFNANIIAYDLGLVKKVDVTSDGEAIKQPEFKIYNNAPPLADSEEKVSKKRN